jgi:hypothetical protein
VESIAPSLRALVAGLIDYAGLYPPAGLPLEEVVERYERYRAGADAWMLNRLVLPAAKLAEAAPRRGWRVSLLVDGEPGPLPREVEALETRLPRRLSLPTYCEAPLEAIDGGFAKVRTGGLTPDAIPPCAEVAGFLARAAALRLPFKATAGLHHALRSPRALTYAADSPCAVMHGFLNVFAAAAFAWHGMDAAGLEAVIAEDEPAAFSFHDSEMRWHGHALSTAQIEEARRAFAHSFGSCSFEEPVAGLRELGLLP